MTFKKSHMSGECVGALLNNTESSSYSIFVANILFCLSKLMMIVEQTFASRRAAVYFLVFFFLSFSRRTNLIQGSFPKQIKQTPTVCLHGQYADNKKGNNFILTRILYVHVLICNFNALYCLLVIYLYYLWCREDEIYA